MKSPQTLTDEESQRLLNHFSSKWMNQPMNLKALRDYTITLLMLDAGLRVGEVTRLLVTDLILADQPMTTLCLSNDTARKGAVRHVPLRLRIQKALTQMNTTLWHTPEMQLSLYAFCKTKSSIPLSTRQVQRIIKRAAQQSIGRPVHPHVLRHTFATNLMRVTSARVVQELLGHKRLTSTQIYTHPNSQDLKNAIDSLK